MSGPKIIDYHAIERERAEAARRRWRALRGRADAFELRCVRAGHPTCVVAVQELVGPSSTDVDRQCDEIESALARATAELTNRQLHDRTREVFGQMRNVLAQLESREQGEAALAVRPKNAGPQHVEVDYTERVGRQLAQLKAPTAALESAAEDVLISTDPLRARLLYSDLVQRISDANRAHDTHLARVVEIAELRAQIEVLTDPEPVRALLDHVAIVVEGGGDAGTQLQQARSAIARQLDAAAADADREFVHRAVAESLAELGYEVADVAVETTDSLVFRQSGSHGVRAQIGNGEIDIRTVTFGSGTTRGADRDAEDEFCRRMPGLLAAMSRRGVAAGLKKQGLPGLVAPETVMLRKKAGAAEAATNSQHRSATRKRTT